ncbi:MAG: dockerin type I repeat-containing protein [Clostridia bacterium]|nr:dockerin type I repeat-containing protein [Clostridia bacterium]
MKKAKRLLSILMVVAIMLSMGIMAFAAEYTLGDVNADGEITAADARLILRNSAELEVLSAEQKAVADINSDGDVTASDARIALRISAELEDIKDYITAIPDEEKVREEDASQYILGTVDDIIASGIELDYDDETGIWNADGFSVLANEYDYDLDGAVDEIEVSSVFIEEESEYDIYGVKYGMTMDEAIEKLADYGIEAEIDEYGDIYVSDYETGMYIFISTYGSEKVEYVEIFYKEIDLGLYIGSDIYTFMYLMPDVKLLNEQENVYGNDYVELYVSDYGYVNYLILKDAVDTISVYGIRLGMTVEQVQEALSWTAFEPHNDYLYDAYFNEGLYTVYSADGTVERVELSRGAYSDLAMYIFDETNFILNDFNDVVADDTGYGSDTVHFGIANDGEYEYVTEVQIKGESDFNILDVEYGMDIDEAVALLASYGYDVEVNTVNYYDNEYIELLSDDGKTVSSIRNGFVIEV